MLFTYYLHILHHFWAMMMTFLKLFLIWTFKEPNLADFFFFLIWRKIIYKVELHGVLGVFFLQVCLLLEYSPCVSTVSTTWLLLWLFLVCLDYYPWVSPFTYDQTIPPPCSLVCSVFPPLSTTRLLHRCLPRYIDPIFPYVFLCTCKWVNLSKRRGKYGVFRGLAGLLRGISWDRSLIEILMSIAASPKKALSIPTCLLRFTFYF